MTWRLRRRGAALRAAWIPAYAGMTIGYAKGLSWESPFIGGLVGGLVGVAPIASIVGAYLHGTRVKKRDQEE